MNRRVIGSILILVPLLLACEAEEPAPDELEVPAATPRSEVAQPATSWPDTTAEAVWAHLQAENYQENWRFWPGREPYYEGVEPHGLRLNTYLNRVAHDALTAGDSIMPEHAIIVKENYTPDSTLVATTVMYKVSGFDPENNDWWWLKRNADGGVEGAGRVGGCISCHSAERDNDFILTATLASQGTEITAAARAAKQGGGN